jgi:hypothetical protein
MNEKFHAPKPNLTSPVTAIDLHGGRPVAGAPGGAGCPATGFPCLLLTTAPGSEKIIAKTAEKPLGSRTAIARKADTLQRNLQALIQRVGIERIGFQTLTFGARIRSRKVAEKRFHTYEKNVLSPMGCEYIAVPERQSDGTIHYHLAVAFPFDIRSGFDFAICSAANLVKKNGYLGRGKWAPGAKSEYHRLEQIYFASANSNLRGVWRKVRAYNARVSAHPGLKTSPAFGRCETLPVLSNAAAISFYIGTYITSQTERRAAEDKGMRSVRYSLKIRLHHQSFHFAAGGNAKWRAGCKALGALLGIQYEDCRSKFGRRWPHHMAPWIFLCYENQDACLKFAATIPPDMVWRERLLTVRQFLGQFKEEQS